MTTNNIPPRLANAVLAAVIFSQWKKENKN